MTAADIVKLLEDNGITAQDEYFPTDVPTPYAVVLTPRAEIDGADIIPRRGGYIIQRKQYYRIELYTKSKSDSARAEFLQLCFKSLNVSGGYSLEEESYGKNRLYMTAIEFSAWENENL